MVRTATAWFLAELAVVVRLCGVAGARRAGGVGLSERDRMRSVRITAPPSTSRADWGLVNVGRRHSPAHSPSETGGFAGFGECCECCECFSWFSIVRARARPHMRKGWKNIHNIPQRPSIPWCHWRFRGECWFCEHSPTFTNIPRQHSRPVNVVNVFPCLFFHQWRAASAVHRGSVPQISARTETRLS